MENPIRVRCPSCRNGLVFALQDQRLRRVRLQCPHCRHEFWARPLSQVPSEPSDTSIPAFGEESAPQTSTEKRERATEGPVPQAARPEVVEPPEPLRENLSLEFPGGPSHGAPSRGASSLAKGYSGVATLPADSPVSVSSREAASSRLPASSPSSDESPPPPRIEKSSESSPPPSPSLARSGQFQGSRPTRIKRRGWASSILFSSLLVGAVLFGVLWNQIKPEKGDGETVGALSVFVSRPVVAPFEWRPAPGTTTEIWLESLLCEALHASLEQTGETRGIPCTEVVRMREDLAVVSHPTWTPARLTEAAGNLGTEFLLRGEYAPEGDGSGSQWRLSLAAQRVSTGEIFKLEPVVGDTASLPGLTGQLSHQLAKVLRLAPASSTDSPSTGALGFPASGAGLRSFGSALRKIGRGDLEGGREDLVAALAVDPESARLHGALAATLAARGQEAEALKALERAIERAAGLEGPFLDQLRALQYQLGGRFLTAAEGYRQLRRERPDDLEMALRELRALAKAGAVVRAQAVVEEVRELPGLAGSDPRIELMAAEIAGSAGDFRAQLASAQKASTVAGLRKARRWQRAAELSLGEALLRLRDLSGAQRAIDRAVGHSRSDDTLARARIENSRAVVQSILGDFESAEASFGRSLELYRNQSDLAAVAAAIANLSRFLAGAGRGDEALNRLREGKEILERLGDNRKLAQLHALESDMHRQVGNLAEAETSLSQALQQASLTEESSQRPELLYQMGSLRAARENFPASRESYQACLDLVTGTGRTWPLLAARAHAGMAEVLLIGDDLAKAREHQEEALALYRQRADERGIAYRRLALASLTLEEGLFDEAIVDAEEIAPVFERLGQVEGLIGAHLLRARGLLDLRRLAPARESLDAAAALATPNTSVASQLSVSFLDARLALAENRRPETIRRLEGLGRSARATRQRGVELEVELALGLEELAAGKVRAGNRRLEAVVTAAQEAGFHLLARKASFAL